MQRDQNGTVVTNRYDDSGRLIRREAQKAAGVEGPAFEAFGYDGLGRMVRAESGDTVVEFTYDEQGRVVAEKQNGKTVGSGYDADGNKTTLVYPSGKTLNLSYDALDRMQTVGAGAPLASYGYEGRAKITEKTAGKVRMQAVYDDGRRPTSLSYANTGTNREILGRTMGWTKTDLKASETRSDENGKTEQYEYDALLRLKKVAGAEKETSFEMDRVGNITERVDREKDVTQIAGFQVNSRNQVTAYKGQPLSYDQNGNLTEYVDRYVYNWKNQLVRVEKAAGGEVHFKYDALGRRVEKSTAAGFVKRYVYDGWRVVEERDAGDGLLTRYTYGNGIDEAVEIEKDRDNDGALESYTPVQNTVGSVVGIADKDGNIVERADYTAYGAPTFIYDHASPEVEVVRIKDGYILIRFSEPVKRDKAQQAIKVKKGEEEISGTVALEDGDRVAKFVPSSALPQNEPITVSISTDLEDLAQNKLNQAFSQAFTYAGSDLIAFDRSDPEVESIRLVSGVIYVEFSEEIDPTTITGAVELSSPVGSVAGAIASTDERTVKFTATGTITPGIIYTVKVKTGVKDLSGKNLPQQVTKTFNTSGSDLIVYQKPDPNHQVASYIGNTTLFQGREYDQETGLYYFRARYLSSELGRFLQPDPKGYVDSMNPYQSFGNNPGNFVDPMGTTISFDSDDSKKLFDKMIGQMKLRANTPLIGPIYNCILNMIDTIERSEIDFHVMYYRTINNDPNQGGISKEVGGITRPRDYQIIKEGKKKIIRGIQLEILMNDTHAYSAISRLGHEITHGYQFLTGKIGFRESRPGHWQPMGYDIYDEVEAHIIQLFSFNDDDVKKNRGLIKAFSKAKYSYEYPDIIKDLYPDRYEAYKIAKNDMKSGREFMPINYNFNGRYIDNNTRYLVDNDTIKRYFVSPVVDIKELLKRISRTQIWKYR